MDYAIVLLLSAVKFMVGVATAIIKGFSFYEQVLITTFGGILGVFLYTYAGDKINNWRRRKFGKKNKEKKLKNWHVKLWNTFGLVGTALLTPPILSPPVGVALAYAFGTERRKIIIYYSLSMAFWSLFFGYFGMLNFKDLFQDIF